MRSMCWVGLGALIVLLMLAPATGCFDSQHYHHETIWPPTGGNTGPTHSDGASTGEIVDTDADTGDNADQAEGVGIVTGTIVDAQTGAPLEGVEVTEADHSAWTDGDGQFTLSDVPAGHHTLLFTLGGYIDAESTFTLAADEIVEVVGGLVPAAIIPWIPGGS